MNHSLKKPDAHRRLARRANAGVVVRGFSRLYQAKAEFKARQLWLDFGDAVGPALEAIADSVDASRKAFKAWLKAFVRPADPVKPSMVQLPLSLVVGWTNVQPISLAA